MKYAVIAMLLLALLGCITASRIEERRDELIQAWIDANPGLQPSPEVLADLEIQAEDQVRAEVEEERKRAAAHGSSALGHALSGNWLLMGFELFGLASLGLSSFRKSRGKK